jgi:hypothetical protein
LQAGQSTADGAFRHSSGEQPQSAQRMTRSVFAFGNVGEGTKLSNTQFLHLIGKGRFGQASPRMVIARFLHRFRFRGRFGWSQAQTGLENQDEHVRDNDQGDQ